LFELLKTCFNIRSKVDRFIKSEPQVSEKNPGEQYTYIYIIYMNHELGEPSTFKAFVHFVLKYIKNVVRILCDEMRRCSGITGFRIFNKLRCDKIRRQIQKKKCFLGGNISAYVQEAERRGAEAGARGP